MMIIFANALEVKFLFSGCKISSFRFDTVVYGYNEERKYMFINISLLVIKMSPQFGKCFQENESRLRIK